MQIGAVVTAIGSSIRLRRFISTLKAQYPEIPIYIGAQGSLDPEIDDLAALPHVSISRLPFDYGLSATRNYLVRKVREPIIFICDDDFVFKHGLDFAGAVSAFERFPGLGVVGGRLLNVNYDEEGIEVSKSEARFANMLIYDQLARILLMLPASVIGGAACQHNGHDLVFCDTVLNFCLIRKDAVFERDIWYDESSKIGGEHFEFFLRIKQLGNVRVAYYDGLFAEHHRIQTGKFLALRHRTDGMMAIFNRIGIDLMIEVPYRVLRVKDGNFLQHFTFDDYVAALALNVEGRHAIERYCKLITTQTR